MRVLAPIGTFVAVVAVAVTASLVGGGTETPPVLNLASPSAKDAAGAPVLAGALAGSGAYRLVGTLPKGRPDDAAAWTLDGGPGPAATVARLASALGVGTPKREETGWQVDGLNVSGEPGRAWSWSSCGGDTPVSSGPVPPDAPSAPQGSSSGTSSSGVGVPPTGSVSIGCAVADAPSSGSGSSGSGSSGSGSSGSGGAAQGAPGTAVAKPGTDVAVPGPAVTARRTSPQQIVPAPPLTSPVPPGSTSGGATPAPPPTAAPPPPPGVKPLYPIKPFPQPKPIPTAKARAIAAPILEALGLQDADVEVSPYGASVSVTPKVDGLETSGFATRIQLDSAGTLVSASGWLSRPKRGDRYPLISAREAFDALPSMPRMLMPCAPPPNAKGCQQPAAPVITGARLGVQLQQLVGGQQMLLPAWLFAVQGAQDPLAVVAVAPRFLGTGPKPSDQPIEPGPVTSDPGQARDQLSIDAAVATAKGLTVTYGESGSCPRTGVNGVAKEDAKSVVVLLEADPMPGDRACTADYHAVKLELTLQTPLGDRAVIDGASGKPVS